MFADPLDDKDVRELVRAGALVRLDLGSKAPVRAAVAKGLRTRLERRRLCVSRCHAARPPRSAQSSPRDGGRIVALGSPGLPL
jgi:hypothetical protein